MNCGWLGECLFGRLQNMSRIHSLPCVCELIPGAFYQIHMSLQRSWKGKVGSSSFKLSIGHSLLVWSCQLPHSWEDHREAEPAAPIFPCLAVSLQQSPQVPSSERAGTVCPFHRQASWGPELWVAVGTLLEPAAEQRPGSRLSVQGSLCQTAQQGNSNI